MLMASFRKIRYSKGQVTLTRIDDRSVTDSIEQTLTSSESPRPEFGKALHALTEWVLEICDLPASYRHGLSITGCTLTQGDAGGMVVTAQKKVSGSNAPMMIHTPHVPEKAVTPNGPELPETVRELVLRLEREAQRFWDGDRAQAGLFQDDNPHKERSDDAYAEDDPDKNKYEDQDAPAPKMKDKGKVKKTGQLALTAGKKKPDGDA